MIFTFLAYFFIKMAKNHDLLSSADLYVMLSSMLFICLIFTKGYIVTSLFYTNPSPYQVNVIQLSNAFISFFSSLSSLSNSSLHHPHHHHSH